MSTPIVNPIHAEFKAREELALIAMDTLVTAPLYRQYFSTQIDYTDLDIPKEDKYEKDAIMMIVNQDTLNLAQDIVSQGFNPLVLNMASFNCPGGGWKRGASAQEEELFRRSNYFRALPRAWYPLKWTTIILSPSITIYKDSFYKEMNTPFKVDMLAAAAIQYPYLINNEYTKEDGQLMFNKIDSMFRVAYFNGNDSLILSAFGAGAYRNPAHEVAKMFKICVAKYRRQFKIITFGILGDNFTVFNDILIQ